MTAQTFAEMAAATGRQFNVSTAGNCAECGGRRTQGELLVGGGSGADTDVEPADLPPLEELAEATGVPVDVLEELDDDAPVGLVEALPDADGEDGGAAENRGRPTRGSADWRGLVEGIGVLHRSDEDDGAAGRSDGSVPPKVLNRASEDLPSVDRDEIPNITTRPGEHEGVADGVVPPSIINRESKGRLPDGLSRPRCSGGRRTGSRSMALEPTAYRTRLTVCPFCFTQRLSSLGIFVVDIAA